MNLSGCAIAAEGRRQLGGIPGACLCTDVYLTAPGMSGNCSPGLQGRRLGYGGLARPSKQELTEMMINTSMDSNHTCRKAQEQPERTDSTPAGTRHPALHSLEVYCNCDLCRQACKRS